MATPRRENLTDAVAGFAAGLSIDQVPEDVRSKLKLHVLDAVGCGVAGAGSDLAQRMVRFLDLDGVSGGCSPLFGTARRFGPASAAFANAAAMNALDFDDGLEVDGKGMGHPGATIVGAAVGAPFVKDVSGADFLTAIAAGFEVNDRLILAMQPSFGRFREVYGVCQHQTVAAAIAFGKLAGLDHGGLHNAIGFAGTLSNVPSLRKYN